MRLKQILKKEFEILSDSLKLDISFQDQVKQILRNHNYKIEQIGKHLQVSQIYDELQTHVVLEMYTDCIAIFVQQDENYLMLQGQLKEYKPLYYTIETIKELKKGRNLFISKQYSDKTINYLLMPNAIQQTLNSLIELTGINEDFFKFCELYKQYHERQQFQIWSKQIEDWMK